MKIYNCNHHQKTNRLQLKLYHFPKTPKPQNPKTPLILKENQINEN